MAVSPDALILSVRKNRWTSPTRRGRRVKCTPTHAGPDPSDPRFVKTTWVPYTRTRIFFTCARVLLARTREAAI